MKKLMFALFILLFVFACDNTPVPDPIPFKIVNKLIDLNNLRYQRLKFDGGFAYEDGGVRGLIIYRRNATSYLAFERNCPFRPMDACAHLKVDDSGFFMKDSCCNSVFDFEGSPISGPAFSPVLRYRVSLTGSLLSITN
ncbi:MAG: hypothetical protein EAZ08_13485 [Cytophagales bacterium]|nr:MAG: hypothetical protein EAZ08_13485 [Cytophagales bacterium]